MVGGRGRREVNGSTFLFSIRQPALLLTLTLLSGITKAVMGWGGGERSEWFNILVLHQATGLSIDINLLLGITIAVKGGGGEE